MTSPQPQSQVGITGAWFDPLDPRTWSGMFARVIEEFENMGVYAGFRDAGPLAGASRALYHWMGLTGRAGGSWMLEPEMRAAAWLSIPAIRRRRPRNAGAWIVPAGTVGRPVVEPEVAWCELSPAQLLDLGSRAADFGLAGVTAGQLRSVAQAHLRLHRRARASCAVSASAARSLVDDSGLDPARVHVVGCGRNIEPSGSMNQDWSRPRFLFVGNDWRRKNGEAVLRAFARLREWRPDARLDVAGGHPAIDQPGVVAHGPLRLDRDDDRARLGDLFAGSTCLVMPSFMEPFGIVYVEAASFGVPSIAGSVGGTATSVGEGGILVDPADDAAILEAMRRMAEERCAAELGARARQRSEQFTWPKVAQRLLRACGPPLSDGLELADFIPVDLGPAGAAAGQPPSLVTEPQEGST